MEDEYVLNDESVVNSHGFTLLNAAGRFERYNANPVMLFNHDSANLIGQMTSLRVEGTKLIGKAVYDEEDPLALKCKRQSKNGILKGCSPGIIINAVELRTTPEGDERVTVTDWELCETSLVSVPSNRNALRLYTKQGELIPDDQVTLSVETLLNINHQKENEMDKIILTAEAYIALGLKSNEADNKALSAAIMELQTRAEKAEKELEKQQKLKAEALVALALTDGRITADKKEQFIKLALADYDMAKSTLESIPTRQTLSGKVTNTKSGVITSGKVQLSDMSFADVVKADRLKELKKEPELYKEKFFEAYGKYPA